MPGVYAIECIPTGELYIGSTARTFAERWSGHKSAFKSRRAVPPKLLKAYDTYGLDALRFIPLKEFPVEELAERERRAIELVKPAFNCNDRVDPAALRRADTAGMSRHTVYRRKLIGKVGEELTAPPYANKRRYLIGGDMLTVPEAATRYGLKEETVRSRVGRGLTGSKFLRVRVHRTKRQEPPLTIDQVVGDPWE